MSKYDSFINMALSLIARKGAPAPIKRVTEDGYDPVTQTYTARNVETHTFQVVALPPSRQSRLRVNETVQEYSLELYIALKGQTMIPAPLDTISWGGDDYKIIWAQTYDPAADGPIMTVAYAD